MKIGILGGTFDPIHLGHLTLACAAQRQFSLDKVLFIPVFQPPHKQSREDIASASMRRSMIELAINGISGLEYCDLEIERKGISYTVDTVKQLAERFPASELFLLIGADSLQNLSSWKDIQDIKKLARIAVARRSGASEAFAEGVLWIEMPEVPFSSSLIREKINKNEPVDQLLPKGVAEFIHLNHLYSAEN